MNADASRPSPILCMEHILVSGKTRENVPMGDLLDAFQGHARREIGDLLEKDWTDLERTIGAWARHFSIHVSSFGQRFWVFTEYETVTTYVVQAEEENRLESLLFDTQP